MTKKAASNKRSVVDEALLSEEVLALSRLLSAQSSDVRRAVNRLKTGVYPVDVVVRVVGDVEVGKAEEQPEKFETAKYLLFALSLLPPAKREVVLSADFGAVDEETEAAMAAMGVLVERVKAKRPMVATAPKVTAHLETTLVERYEHVALPPADDDL